MNPPLRGKEHVETIIAGLKDGTIDCIASDHAPHPKEKKMQELDQAPFGVVGLETSLGLVVTRLIAPGHLDWPMALAKLTINPARILNLKKGTLRIGADADITVIDPAVRWRRSREVPLQEQQHTLCRMGIARPGRGRGCGWGSEIEEECSI